MCVKKPHQSVKKRFLVPQSVPIWNTGKRLRSGGITLPKFKVIQRHDDERVADFAGSDKFRNVGDGNQPSDDVFALVPLNRMFELGIFHEQGMAGVAHDGGIGKNLADYLRPLSFVTGFLAQFPDACGGGRGVLRVNDAAGDFQLHRVRALAILLDHHQLPVGCDGDDVDPIDAVEDEEVMFFAGAWVDTEVGTQLEDAKITDEFGTDFFPRFNHAKILTQRRREKKFLNLRTSALSRPALPHESQQMLQSLFVRTAFLFSKLSRAFIELSGHFRRFFGWTAKRG